MKLNRRDALLAILAMPSATGFTMIQEMQDQNGGKLSVVSQGMYFVVNLADADEAAKSGGMFELQITYKGQQIKFSAKEIWDALKQPSGASLS